MSLRIERPARAATLIRRDPVHRVLAAFAGLIVAGPPRFPPSRPVRKLWRRSDRDDRGWRRSRCQC